MTKSKRQTTIQFSSLRHKAFSLVELILVIAILGILAGVFFFSFSSLLIKTELDTKSIEVRNLLRTAQNQAAARWNDSRWGVYFDIPASQATLFAGPSFAARNQQFDTLLALPLSVKINALIINGGGTEVVFRRGSGETTQFGSVTLTGANGTPQTIYFNAIGQIGFNEGTSTL